MSCHPNGLTDGIVWIFGAGPRRTLPLNGSFNPRNPHDIKILNYSGINDEIQDFEANIRNVSGGLGLITLADGVTQDAVLNSFNPPNAGRSELLDALAAFVARGIRTPLAPLASAHGAAAQEVGQGRAQFAAANCAACHGGAGWSAARRDYTPPPAATEIVNGQVIRLLRNVGTFDPAAANEIRQNGAPPLGAAGFAPPSLLGEHGLGPYLHNGSASTLLDVLGNVTHRSAGTGGVDVLSNLADRRNLARFLESIDASTEPFPIGTPAAPAVNPTAMRETAAAGAAGLSLRLAGPHPVRSQAAIFYTLPQRTRVDLAVFDLQGRRIATLARGSEEAGSHSIRWGVTSRLAPGVYLVRLRTGLGTRVTRAVVEP